MVVVVVDRFQSFGGFISNLIEEDPRNHTNQHQEILVPFRVISWILFLTLTNEILKTTTRSSIGLLE